MSKVEQWYQAAYAKQKAGDLDGAAPLYRRILEKQPHHAEALYLLGSLHAQRREYAEALPYLERALARNAKFTEAHNNRGIALKELGQLDEAIASYDRALAARPDYAEALNNRGIALQAAGRLEDALDDFRRSYANKPDYPEPLNNLGIALKDHGRLSEAETVFREAVALRPQQAETINNLGLTLLAQGRFEEALDCLNASVALCPTFPQAFSNRGAVLQQLARFEEARADFARALELKPDYIEALNNLGVCHIAEGNLEAGMASLDHALACAPEHVNTHWNRSLGLLLRGDLAEGWREYEWRFRNKSVAEHITRKPLWDGSDLTGRTILVHAEQGLGDTINFVRYLPSVKARGGRVLFECPRHLTALVAGVPGIDALLVPPAPGEDHAEPYDVQIPLLSLPCLLGTTLETIPAEVPYLRCPAPLRENWRQRLEEITTGVGNRCQLKVGLVWAGSPVHKNDHNRSCALADLAPLAQTPGVTFFSLQKGPGAAQAANAPAGMTLIDLDPALNDFADTAAVIEQLDLIIAVDTSVLHMAGALGKPVWALIPFSPDWRWLTDREDSPWYPTMRLFRQPAPRAWTPVIARVAEELAELATQANVPATETDDADALVLQGEFAFAAGDTMGAYQRFEAAIALAPGHRRALNDMAVLAHTLGAFDEAISLFEQILKTEPNHDGALENMARCWEAKGDFAQAASWYQQALAQTPLSPPLWQSLAGCCLRLGEHEAAQEALAQCRRLLPGADAPAPSVVGPLEISVILRAWGQDADLHRARDAWAGQTLSADQFELLVIEDMGSAAASRNAGLARAHGRLVVFADSDSRPAPDFLQTHIKAHARHGAVPVAVLSRRAAAPDMTNAVLFHVLEDAPATTPDYADFRAAGASFKREFLTTQEIAFDENLSDGAEDWDFARRLTAQELTIVAETDAVLFLTEGADFAGHCERAAAEGRAAVRLAHPQRWSEMLHRLDVADAEQRLAAVEAEWRKAEAMSAQLRTLEQAGWEAVRALPEFESRIKPALAGLCQTGLAVHRLRAAFEERRRLEAADTQRAVSAPQASLVSIIIACYNYAHFLPESVASVLGQTYRNWELIIVNDGSTDDTVEVAERLIAANPDRRIRMITQENKRLAGARNAGIREAQGDYILPLDADDTIAPTMIAKCVAVLDDSPHVSMAYTDQTHFNETGRVWAANSRDWDFAGELYVNQLCVCCLFRRSMWAEVGGYREDCVGAEDWDFWIAAGERGHAAWRIAEALFRYRKHGASLSVVDDLRQDYLKADIVQHHPHLFGPARVRWARGVTAGYEWLHPKADWTPTPATALVSVIVPTYNRPKMLVHALESILAQTYRHFEIIVVNDAGPDVSEVIAPLNVAGRITLINKPANKGLADSRNVGIAAARGKYIAYLDDDDEYYPDHLETLVTFLENTGYEVAYADALRAHQHRNAAGEYETWHRDQPYSTDFDYNIILCGNFSPVQCYMHAKSCIDAVGGFDTTLTSHEDWELWLRLSRRYDCVHLKKTTSEFTWRQDGSTMTGVGTQNNDFARTTALIYRKHYAEATDPRVRAHYDAFLNQWEQAQPSHTSPAKPVLVAPTVTLTARVIKERGLNPYQPCPCGSGEKLKFCHYNAEIDAKLLARASGHWQTDIIVVVHNQLDYTRNCIESLYRHTRDFHLWLWDNGSDAETRDYLTDVARRENVTLERSEENLGFIIPNNRLAAQGRAPYLILLNSDTEVRAGWGAKMLDYLKAHPEVGEVGYEGGLLGPDGVGCGQGEGDEIDYVAGWCACLSRKTYEQHGLLDEEHLQFAYGEDSDLSLRLQDAGLRVHALPDGLVTHYGNKTIAEVSRRRDTRSTFAANHTYFRQRWAKYLAEDRVIARQERARSQRWEQELAEAEGLSVRGDTAAAQARFEALAAENPQDARPWNNLGVVLWHAGQHTPALQSFAQAYGCDPQDRATVQNLADALCAFGQTADAAGVLQVYADAHPDDAEMTAKLAGLAAGQALAA